MGAVFIQNTDMSDAAREESIATAVTETFAQFDSINQDGKIDKDEFLKHLKDVQFPSFPDQQLDPNAMTEMIDGHASGKQQTKVPLCFASTRTAMCSLHWSEWLTRSSRLCEQMLNWTTNSTIDLQ